MSDPVIVIGAGIVGTAVARRLQRTGHTVTLIDSVAPGTSTSYGNAGYIAITPVLPLARPAILKQVPRMLMDRKSPLRVHRPSAPALLPWMARFALAASSREQVRKTTAAFDALMRDVDDAWKDEIRASRLEALFRRNGALYVYESEELFSKTAADREMQRDWGVELRDLGGAEARELAPGLSDEIVRATFYPNGFHSVNPGGLAAALADRFSAEGGEFVSGRVSGFGVQGNEVKSVKVGDRDLRASHVVIAAGGASGKLTRMLGFKAPLVAERGYHVMLEPDNLRFDFPISFVSRGFFITPMDDGLRLAGKVELARPGQAPSWDHIGEMMDGLKEILPNVGGSERSRWVGERPTLPDFRPAIGRAPRHANVLCAYGHHHLGLTLSTATADVIDRQLRGEDLGEALSWCDPGRFG